MDLDHARLEARDVTLVGTAVLEDGSRRGRSTTAAFGQVFEMPKSLMFWPGYMVIALVRQEYVVMFG